MANIINSINSTPPDDHPPIQPRKTGVLLVNLGTPSGLTLRAIRRYLAEFLSDRRVIDYPPWLWQPILRGIILNIRPARTRRAYREIWNTTDNESPLRTHTRRQTQALQQRLGDAIPTHYAMTYGQPSIRDTLQTMQQQGIQRILVLPLYPQYSATTTGPVYDRIFRTLMAQRRLPALRILDTWHDDPRFIDACTAHLTQALATLDFTPDTLVLSFHGLPRRYLQQGDPYHCFCQKTARLIAQGLARSHSHLQVLTTFQSRFGAETWLQPYTDETLQQLGKEHRRVAIFSPAFIADNIETLEELGIQGRDKFRDAGGQHYALLSCLNDSDIGIDLLESLTRQELAGWIDTDQATTNNHTPN